MLQNLLPAFKLPIPKAAVPSPTLAWLLSSLTAGSFKVHGEWRAHVNEILFLHLSLLHRLHLSAQKNHSLPMAGKAGNPFES